MTDQPDARWQCQHCGAWFPVQVLARDHEAMHERKAAEGDR